MAAKVRMLFTRLAAAVIMEECQQIDQMSKISEVG